MREPNALDIAKLVARRVQQQLAVLESSYRLHHKIKTQYRKLIYLWHIYWLLATLLIFSSTACIILALALNQRRKEHRNLNTQSNAETDALLQPDISHQDYGHDGRIQNSTLSQPPLITVVCVQL